MAKVPVQKGKITPDSPKTMKMKSLKEKLVDRSKEIKGVKSGETLVKKGPKKY